MSGISVLQQWKPHKGEWIRDGGLHCFNHLKFHVDANGVATLNWNTANCTSFQNMFDFCRKLTKLDISSWNFARITNTDRMFDCCLRISNIEFPARTDLTKVTDMLYMFAHCWALGTQEVIDIIATFFIDNNTNMIFRDTTGNEENANRILNGNMPILTENIGARRVLSTYGQTNNIYLDGKGDSTVERATDYARLVFIPKARYETAPVGDDYKFITFTAQYNCYDFFDAKVSTESKTFRGSGNEKYTGDPSSDGDITITSGRWAKDGDASSYEDVKNPKTVTVTNGEFTFGNKTMMRQ